MDNLDIRSTLKNKIAIDLTIFLRHNILSCWKNSYNKTQIDSISMFLLLFF